MNCVDPVIIVCIPDDASRLAPAGVNVTRGPKFFHFASAAVVVDSNHMTASSSASWSRFSPPSNFINGHVSTMWFMVCRSPQSQEGD